MALKSMSDVCDLGTTYHLTGAMSLHRRPHARYTNTADSLGSMTISEPFVDTPSSFPPCKRHTIIRSKAIKAEKDGFHLIGEVHGKHISARCFTPGGA